MIADGVMTSYWFYKMAAIASPIYFRFLIWPRLKFRKVQSYRHTKCGPDISIHGRDITTSGFWKQTAAILKFYFRFRFWPFYYHFRFRKQTNAIWKLYIRFRFWTFYRHLYIILQGRNKLCLNWTITERVMTLCRFFPDGEYTVVNILLLSGFMTSRLQEGK